MLLNVGRGHSEARSDLSQRPSLGVSDGCSEVEVEFLLFSGCEVPNRSCTSCHGFLLTSSHIDRVSDDEYTYFSRPLGLVLSDLCVIRDSICMGGGRRDWYRASVASARLLRPAERRPVALCEMRGAALRIFAAALPLLNRPRRRSSCL